VQARDTLTAGAVLRATQRDRLAREAMAAAMIERLAERGGASVQTCDGGEEGSFTRGETDAWHDRPVCRIGALGDQGAAQDCVRP